MGKTEASIWDDPNLPSDKATAINRARMATYGDPAPNYVMLAALWSAMLGIDVSPPMAAQMMVQVKIMREVCGGFNPDYPDNLEDQCGFVNVLYRVKEANRGPVDTAT